MDKNKSDAVFKAQLRVEIGLDTYSRFCHDVGQERARQIKKFGTQPLQICNAPPGDAAHLAAWYGLATTPELRSAVEAQMARGEEDIMAILLEEVGEALDAARAYQADPSIGNRAAVEAELTQVATVCLKGLEQLRFDAALALAATYRP